MSTVWKSRLRDKYDNSFGLFEAYDLVYNLSHRFGFSSAEAAWEANPMIQGGMDPGDLKVVPAGKMAWQPRPHACIRISDSLQANGVDVEAARGHRGPSY
jgi:hypothetical protein